MNIKKYKYINSTTALQSTAKMTMPRNLVKHIQINDNKIDLSNTQYSKFSKYIPRNSHKSVQFEIHNTTPAFANAIRRCLTNELDVKYLTIHMDDISTNDDFIAKDVIQQRIEMISIDQDIPDNAIFNLTFESTQDMLVKASQNFTMSGCSNMDIDSFDVFTDNMKLTNSKNTIPPNNYFNNFINICCLKPLTYINFKNIKVQTAKGIDNGRTSLGAIGFKWINHDMTKSSLNSTPTACQIHLKTNGNIPNPKLPIIWATLNIKKRLDNIYNALNKQSDEFVYFVIEFNIFKLRIQNESHTIGKLLVQYIYNLDPSINYVAPRTIHPSNREVVIDIKHVDAKNICMQAILNIKKDFDQFESYFK